MLWPRIISNSIPIQTLGDESREVVWVDLKKKILVTDAYRKPSAYERLYNRCEELLSAFITRHQHYPAGIEAKWGEQGISEALLLFVEKQREHAASLRYYGINNSLSLENTLEDRLFYACWFAYIGGRSKYIPGQIMSDHGFLCKSLDYLINERKSMDAVFFKGLILKYGLGVSGKPDLIAARKHLERAAQSGLGAAALELRYLDKHSALEAVTSVHVEDRSWLNRQ